MKRIFILILAFFAVTFLQAQVFTNKEVGKRGGEIADSLKQSTYKYFLPIWGEKATAAGYSLPYSAGLSVQYFQQESPLIIENLLVGFNNGPMYDLDGIVRFDEAIADANAFTFRPDVWLFPFLNVYAILGSAAASTGVNFGVWIPDSTGISQEVIKTGTTVEFNTTTFGFGVTPTIGIGGGFMALDMNVTWIDVPQLSKPARSFVFGPRFGKNFRLKNPDRSIVAWVGGFRVNIASETNGSIELSEVIDSDGQFEERINQGEMKVQDFQIQVETWWNALSPIEQSNPVNKAKHDRANAALDRTAQFLDAAGAAVSEGPQSTVQYSMDKYPKDMWNFIVGSQYQLNRHFMMRAEFGLLGSRTQGMVGLQYRFGI